jgi:hypothetical protein
MGDQQFPSGHRRPRQQWQYILSSSLNAHETSDLQKEHSAEVKRLSVSLHLLLPQGHAISGLYSDLLHYMNLWLLS